MLPNKREDIHGWGRAPVTECVSYRPEKQRELRRLLASGNAHLIARGLGRSYGDAAMSPQGVVRMERFDHYLDFDSHHGIVHAQAGLSLAALMDFCIPRGWLPPVIPGTRYVTLGGAFASNVHGKNHFREGDFAEHVLKIRLMLASGESVECSPNHHAELFWATAGGMGMTGIIEEITLKLKPISSLSLRTTTYRVGSIEDMVGAFEHYCDQAEYMVGWIDHMATGRDIGRGMFEAASHLSHVEGGRPLSEFKPLRPRFSVPLFAPSFLLNRYVMAKYNQHRFKKYSAARHDEIADFDGFFHPLDAIGNWNRLYGKRGFFQYQCLIPASGQVVSQLRTFLSAIQEQGLFSFLAVIKYHRDGVGLLTFPRCGYSVALDFPNTARVRALLPQLDRWIADHGGRVYLAKDALLSRELFDRMYGEQGEQWRRLINDLDPQARFTSLMAERLQWKPKA